MTLRKFFQAALASVSLSLNVHGLAGVPAAEASGDATDPVGFSTSCLPEATVAVKRGVTDLHNMMYASARKAFDEATRADKECAMAVWGTAMTYIHPVWNDQPDAQQYAAIRERIYRAMEKGVPTEREQAYLNTVRAFFFRRQ